MGRNQQGHPELKAGIFHSYLSTDLGRGFMLGFICLVLFAGSGCRPSPQFQDHFAIPGGAWNHDYQPKFKFQIDDTAAAYQLSLLIRHTDAYPFSNIWINMDTQSPNDTTWGKMRIEIPLAAPSGQWLGRGAGEIYEQRVAITSLSKPAHFSKKGIYTIRLSHDMRRNPLPEILTIGLQLENLSSLPK